MVIDWEAEWEEAVALGFDVDAQTLQFPGLAGSFCNPKGRLKLSTT